MTEKLPDDVTALEQPGRDDDPEAAARLLATVYNELRELARARLAHLPPGQTLQPTALVHEAYLRLLGKEDVRIESRRHFFFAAARAMRDILVEQARAKGGPKRGGDRRRVPLDDAPDVAGSDADEVLALHEALQELERENPERARLVDLRYFAGMTMAEAAQVLNTSERTLHRQWRFARAWLKNRLGAPADPA